MHIIFLQRFLVARKGGKKTQHSKLLFHQLTIVHTIILRYTQKLGNKFFPLLRGPSEDTEIESTTFHSQDNFSTHPIHIQNAGELGK